MKTLRAFDTPPRKVLVCEIAGLGDNVHLLPALHLLREQWPQTELHVLVAEPVAGLFKLTPWVHRVWTLRRDPKPTLLQQWRLAGALRQQRFDVVIDTKGTDRSSLLCWLTGAPVRVGRRPADGGPPGWRHLFTEVVEYPYYTAPMYLQKWRCLRQAGLGGESDQPRFCVQVGKGPMTIGGVALEGQGYLHASPCTSSADREIPPPQLAVVLDRLRAAMPGLGLVLSCMDHPRERQRMDEVVSLLQSPPSRVFKGELDVAALAALIRDARLNLSGDTGSLHLPLMVGTPALAWFRPHRGQVEWMPEDRERYRVLVAAQDARRDALHGLANGQLVQAALELLGLRADAHH